MNILIWDNRTNVYADLRPNRSLCLAFSSVMAKVAPGHAWPVGENMEAGPYSTDQGMLVVLPNL
jgi:hypothetical protein